jgi:transcriptional regulator with XRE-family HTH domain
VPMTKLALLRAEANISGEVVCETTGLNRSYLSRIELGKKTPSIRTLWKLAHFYSAKLGRPVRVDDLIEDHLKQRAVAKP